MPGVRVPPGAVVSDRVGNGDVLNGRFALSDDEKIRGGRGSMKIDDRQTLRQFLLRGRDDGLDQPSAAQVFFHFLTHRIFSS
jgi:hypothetical protein